MSFLGACLLLIAFRPLALASPVVEGISQGDTREKVISTLGEPESSLRMGECEILSWGQVEVVLKDQKVTEARRVRADVQGLQKPGPPPGRILPKMRKPSPSQATASAEAGSRFKDPDLDVTFIERRPRYPSLHGRVNCVDQRNKPYLTPEGKAIQKFFPGSGEQVTFTGHVTNKGKAWSGPVRFLWQIDGLMVQSGEMEIPGRDQDVATSVAWIWREGPHTVSFQIDPLDQIKEVCETNNIRTDRTDGLGFVFKCSREAYDEWNGQRNMVGSYSFEDWMNWHFDKMNEMFRQAIYPSTPQGCLAAVRVDFFSLDDSSEGEKLECSGGWTFRGNDKGPDKPDEGLIHELGHQLGLIDEYQIGLEFIHNRVKDRFGLPAMRGYVFWDPGCNMYGCGLRYCELCAGALNRQIGYPRGYFGSYLLDLADHYGVRPLDRFGYPLSEAKVTFYKEFGGILVERQTGVADSNGVLELKNEEGPREAVEVSPFELKPTPFGKIDILGRHSVLCFHVEARGQEEFVMTEISRFVVQYWRSEKSRRVIVDLKTRIGSAEAPAPPARLDAAWGAESPVFLTWRMAETSLPVTFNVYGASMVDPYSAVLGPTKLLAKGLRQPQYEGPCLAGHGMRFFVTCVDALGCEGGPSNEAWLPTPPTPDDLVQITYEASRSRLLLSYGTRVYSRYDTGMFLPRTVWFCGAGGLVMDPHRDNLYVAASASSNNGGLCAMLFNMQMPPRGPLMSYDAPMDRPQLRIKDPVDVAVDGHGAVVVADRSGGRVVAFSRAQELIADFGGAGPEDREILRPLSVAILPGGHVIVGDEKRGRLVACKIRALDDISYRVLKGAFPKPTDLVVDSKGNLLIVDKTLHSVTALSPPLYDTPRILSVKDLVAPTSAAIQKDGTLTVYDAGRPGMEVLQSFEGILPKDSATYLDSLSEEGLKGYSILPEAEQGGFMDMIDARDWMMVGPFGNVEDEGYETVYPPELESDVDPKRQYRGVCDAVSWEPLPSAACVDGRFVRLDHFVAPMELACVYLTAWVDAPEERTVRLFAGADDGILVWVNEKKVLSKRGMGPMKEDQESSEVHMKQGRNRILVKVCNQLGLWGFQLRFCEPGSLDPVQGLDYVRRHEE